MARNKVKDISFGLTDLLIKENLSKTIFMEKVSITGLMEDIMMVIGSTI